MYVLEAEGLRKTYGSVQAVADIGFAVGRGEVFTIIGPNGAGKTTTLEMIEGLVPPDAGRISFGGLNWKQHADAIRRKIGVQPQSSAMFDLLTPEENLDLFASFYDKARKTEDILNMINLTDHRSKLVKSLSGGQRQRLAIGLAMISDPEIIFLDEPTTGLDPQARRNIWDIVLTLKSLGKTTILTTHYMEEAEQLSDRVCIVDAGRVVALDTPKALIKRLTKEREVRLSFAGFAETAAGAELVAAAETARFASEPERAAPDAARYAADAEGAAAAAERFVSEAPGVVRTERSGADLAFWSERPEESLFALFGFTKERGIRVEQVSIREMSLEDVFFAYTGKEWRD